DAAVAAPDDGATSDRAGGRQAPGDDAVDQTQQTRRPVAELALFGQRGWVGLIVLLLALVIVALLAQTVLKSYGMLGAGAPVKAQRGVGGPAAPVAPETAGAPSVPTTPIERARGLEQQLQRDAQEQAQRIDEQTK